MKWIRQYRLVLLLALTSSASAAEKDPLFQDDTVMKAVLTAPISQAYAQRAQDVRIYFPGQWTFTNSDGESQRLDVSIRTRGNFRREYCALPPLQLNFRKSQVKGTQFKGQNKLKLVAPCQNGPVGQQNVLMEYMAYRIFEILTDRSFGTRLMRLSYIDSDERMSSWTDLVFVIEDDEDVAKRLKLERLNIAYNEFGQLDQATTTLVELFQLMIGNNDYSILKGADGEFCCHNVEMFADEEVVGKRVVIPFDFDMSGLVYADYAAPPAHLPIKSVRTRYYRGLCQPPEIFDAAIAHILSKREEITALFDETEELSRLSRNRTSMYMKRFFELLEDDEKLDKEVVGRCRGTEQLEYLMAEEKKSIALN
jgi:hypothetical protein